MKGKKRDIPLEIIDDDAPLDKRIGESEGLIAEVGNMLLKQLRSLRAEVRDIANARDDDPPVEIAPPVYVFDIKRGADGRIQKVICTPQAKGRMN